MTKPVRTAKSANDREILIVLLIAGVFWSAVGVGVWQVKSTFLCATELASDIKTECAKALHEPFTTGSFGADLVRKRAQRLYDANDYRGAIDVSTAVSDGQYGTKELHSLRALSFRALDQPDKAVEEFKNAHTLSPNDETSFNDLVSELRNQKRYDEAVQVTSGYATRNPQSNFAYYWWGSLEEDRGNHTAAVEKYGAAVSLDPTDHYSIKGMARAQVALRQYDAALESYGKAIAASNNDSYSIELRADLYQRLGRFAEAQADYQSILDQERQPYILVALANSHMDQGKFAEAEPLVLEALAKEVEYVGAHIAFTRLQLIQKQFANARHGVESIKAHSAENAAHWQARIDLAEGKYEAAIAGLTPLLKHWPGDHEVRVDLGHALLDVKRDAEALALFDEAVKLGPSIADARSGRSRAYFQMGKFSEALEDAEQALALKPRDAAAFARRAMALGKLKAFDRAATDFVAAIGFEPQTTWIAEAHIEMLIDANRLKEAAQQLAKLTVPASPSAQALKTRLQKAQQSSQQ
jgi:tetratricopeptide (TPR) repeat protein